MKQIKVKDRLNDSKDNKPQQAASSRASCPEMLRLFNWPKAAAILMTFDEDDFQKLVLNENGDIHEACLLSRADDPKVR